MNEALVRTFADCMASAWHGIAGGQNQGHVPDVEPPSRPRRRRRRRRRRIRDD
jgi:hypothetical protein